MKCISYSLFFTILLVLSGCESYRTYSMEVLRPAMVTPSGMNGRILLINNCIPQPANVGQYYMGLNKEGRDTSYTIPCRVDSFVDLLQGYIAARIESEGVITNTETVSVTKNGIGKKLGSAAFLRIDSLDTRQRLQLKRLTNASLWASLDGLLVESLESCGQQDTLFPQMRMVFVRTFWRVYDATSDSLLVTFKHRDSLMWNTIGTAPGVTKKPLPSLKVTLPEIADFVAGEVYRVFTPYWESIERFYYVTGNLQLKLGYDEVKAGNWDKAALYWQHAYTYGTGLDSYRASVNMMLLHESRGELLEALAWAERANVACKRSFFPPVAYELQAFKAWEQALRIRLEELERVNRFLDESVR